MIMMNENILKAANRLFLLLIALSILLLFPWHPRDDTNIPNSLLEWISMHLTVHDAPTTTTTTTHGASSPHDRTGRSHPSFGGEEAMNGKFMHALAHGFYDVGIVLAAWYVGMCALGGACRVYLCVEECWSRRLYRVLPLYGVDGEEEEGADGDAVSLGEMDVGNSREVREEED